ncbi:MAG: FAD-binding protein, partial [Clostridia bacterium]|nr:FAD-binding protein [Clostridia bacterium]
MSNCDIINQVEKSNDFCFANYTTYGLGGKAKIAYFPKTEQEAVAVFNYLNSSGEKFVILGNGSNVLASDKFYDGAVISTKNLKGIEKRGDTLYCLSGTTVQELLKFCQENGLGGLEYLVGIPASLGGLALMNGGVPSRHIESDIQSVTVFDGEIRNLSNKNCNFGNKHST